MSFFSPPKKLHPRYETMAKLSVVSLLAFRFLFFIFGIWVVYGYFDMEASGKTFLYIMILVLMGGFLVSGIVSYILYKKGIITKREAVWNTFIARPESW
jgi:hypothetical protein